MSNEAWKEPIINALKDAYDGSGGVYLDPGTNVVAELKSLTGAQASTILPGAGNSVVNQIRHLLITVDAHEPQFTGGNQPDLDWGSEWKDTQVTDAEWQALVAEYEETRDKFTQWISAPAVAEDDAFAAAAVMAATHMAYHTGQIRHAAAYAANHQGIS